MQASTLDLYSVFHGLTEGIALASPEGGVFFANQSADRILGVRRTAPLPQGWTNYYSVYFPDGETLFPVEQWPINRALHGEVTTDVQMVIRNPSHPLGRLISVTAQPLLDESGSVLAAAAVFRDLARVVGETADGPATPLALPARTRNAPKVLVIDDDDSVRRTVARMLTSGGYEAVVAENGRDGIEAMIRTRFDVVITDLLMPEQEGIETIQRVRELDAAIPIIAISGSFGDDDFSPLDDARMMGADFALEKPFSVEQLLAAVADAFDRGNARS